MCIISNIHRIYSDDVRDTNSVLIQVRGIQIQQKNEYASHLICTKGNVRDDPRKNYM